MHVRKFEADTIDEALREIKRELGPDAVILKTVTNKGLKSAFKKHKIEITAAISEKSYVKKAQVDHVLDGNQKQEFYNGSASYIANMIDKHDESRKAPKATTSAGGYGSMGLNKQVSTTKKVFNDVKNNLDDFLSLGERETTKNFSQDFDFDSEVMSSKPVLDEPKKSSPRIHTEAKIETPREKNVEQNFELSEKQKNKIEELEKKLFELTKNVERIQKKEPTGIYQLRTTLRSLEISESYIQKLIKKGLFELTEKDVENADIVFEFALREMMTAVQTDMPLFSRVDAGKNPVITVFVTEASSGQSTLVSKIASLKKDALVIKNNHGISETKSSFAEKVFNLNVTRTSTIAEIVAECRKGVEAGNSIFIDYKCTDSEINETKRFIDGLRRAFPQVEVLITICAIQSELYNRKVISKYRPLADGLVVSHLDECLNFGSLFNISFEVGDLPYKFFGTGTVVPDDLEAATSERIMAGLFKLN